MATDCWAPGRRSCSSPLFLLLSALILPVLPGGTWVRGAAAAGESGRPIISNYNRRDFGAEVQQWDVVQDGRGIMYFANNAGVLEFDGRSWRLIELPSRLGVRALSFHPGAGGRVYVGGSGDFGFLAPDAIGQLQFHSLLPAEARDDRSFDQVFTPAVAHDGAVYFHSKNKTCRGSSLRVACRPTDADLSRIFAAGPKVYVQQPRVGLMEIDGDRLRLVPGGERFADEEIGVVLPHRGEASGRILVGLRTLEMFASTDRGFEPFAPGLRDGRPGERLFSGAALPDGSYALGTRYGGLLIVGPHGSVVRQIDRASGLQDNYVHAVLPDGRGGVWLALQTGASRVEVTSPFSVFDKASGLEQEWRAIIRHEGSLYVRGYDGLFEARLAADGRPVPGSDSPQFRRVTEIGASVRSLLPVGDRLLVSSLGGVDEIRNKHSRRIAAYTSLPLTMYRSRSDPNRVFVGLTEGLASLYLRDGTWRDEGRITGIDETITSIAEAAHGSLWLVSQRQRILQLTYDAGPGDAPPARRQPRVRLYPSGPEALTGRISIHEIAGRPVFLTDRHVLQFDDDSGGFEPVPALAALSAAGRRSFSWVAEDRHGNIWVASRRPGGVDFLRRQPDGRYRLEDTGLRQTFVWSIYPEEHSDVVWLSTPEHLLRYDPAHRRSAPAPFTTLIRRVTADDTTLVYGGAPAAGGSNGLAAGAPAFAYGAHSLQFEFAATAFDAPELNEYQSRLEGFDRDWSAWSRTPTRVYTNLSPGQYRFLVRGRDLHGRTAESSAYAFSVLPPWYRASWAFALYGVGFVGFLVLIRRVELQRSRSRLRRELESMELAKLRELDALKSRFFADISHEFRTPLTLILGPVRQMLEEPGTPRALERLQVIRGNAESLLLLISQILDLSKLEARGMRLSASAGDLADYVRAIVHSFTAAAETQGVELTFASELPVPMAGGQDYFDRDVLLKIVNNLVGNALKFTPRGGRVSVTVSAAGPASGGAAAVPAVQIVVADTGVGMPPETLPHIFDRFYQIDGVRAREGIGIGLALVKELVDLHHGTIHVESGVGHGTAFTIQLPTGGACLAAGECVPAAEPTAPRDGRAQIVEALASPGLPAPSQNDSAVLIVEDNGGVRHFVKEQLRPYYRVLEAENGAQGFDLAASFQPDLVLSDVMMPAMDGYALCRELKHDRRTCHIPVVLLTARAGRDDRLLGFDTGADAYLVKPFDSSELLVQVRNLIELRRRLRQRFSGPVVLKPSEMAVPTMDEAFLQKVLDVVQEHLADPEFDVVRLGREVGLSRSQLHRKLRTLTQQSPTLLIRSIRLQRAAELLRHKGGSVAQIAYCVGFNSQAYFAKCFREELGCSPREYAAGSRRQ